VIVGAAIVPHPPLLLPGVTGTAVPEVEKLRSAAADAVAWAAGSADQVVAVGGADATSRYPNRQPLGSGFLGDAEPPARLPLSLSVVRTLLPADAHVEFFGVSSTADPSEAAALGFELAGRAERTALIVAGDGSARRGPKAPGYEDDRARPFDGAVTAAFASADTETLAALDPVLAAELLVAGRAAWQVLAAACADGRWDADIAYADDPFGVYYLVARWSRR
jgi:hypothetical protein